MLIGISGKARHGKDTFYKTVLAPRGFDRIALADPVKGLAMVNSILDDGLNLTRPVVPQLAELIETHFYSYFGSSKSEHVRTELQGLGTDLIRKKIHPGFWVCLALEEARVRVQKGDPVAFTDVRFANEADAVKGIPLGRFTGGSFCKHTQALQEAIHWKLSHTWDEEHEQYGFGALPSSPGLVIKVKRPALEQQQQLTAEQQAHESEASVDTVIPDHLIEANTVPELKAQGDAILNTLGIEVL
ncbi:hypothetical protein [Deinococcus cellulosilyticus]|uniref:Deoxynucleotide monophosphate kinase n=1 Tax=Deinococcus cellulosilyticus (strain DSM 18568 / NBRC 106333 / KACC 11606 / 5516J-15) TaxID=1223518 RepID=A0A511N756_DEIC1|nr:hypothetical protein [Deinococcus cellulosilyticus]GEM48660.1 hypothetical protein DC3_42950 [Deinococcus cellulosilyticus NBRC 106333 = KACC 11606]